MRSAAASASTVETRASSSRAVMPGPVAGRAGRAGAASASSPARTSAAPIAATAPGRSPSASTPSAGRGQRLGERERRGLAGRELAQPAGEQHVGERGRDRAEEQRHREPVRGGDPRRVAEHEHRQQQDGAERERGRHDALGRVAAAQHPLGQDRVGRVAGAGDHGEHDPERVGGGARRRRARAAGRRQQASAVAAAQRPVSGSPSTSRPARPAIAGAEPSATTVPTATPVRSTAAKNASW